jgi:DICT domain-containing protein
MGEDMSMPAPIAATFDFILSHIQMRSEAESATGSLTTETDTFRTFNSSLMLSISHYIEDRFTERRLSGLFIAAFPKVSFFWGHRDRYASIARTASGLFILGEADAPPPISVSGLRLFDPRDEEFKKYWIVLSDSPYFRIALFARERGPARRSDLNGGANGSHVNGNGLSKRNFEGFWTYRDEYITLIRDSVQNHYAIRDYEVTPRPARRIEGSGVEFRPDPRAALD